MRHGACGALIGIAVALAALSGWAEPVAAQVAEMPVLPIPGDPLGGSVTPFEGSAAGPNPIHRVPDPPTNPSWRRTAAATSTTTRT
jgi:hypothetical protein